MFLSANMQSEKKISSCSDRTLRKLLVWQAKQDHWDSIKTRRPYLKALNEMDSGSLRVLMDIYNYWQTKKKNNSAKGRKLIQ